MTKPTIQHFGAFFREALIHRVDDGGADGAEVFFECVYSTGAATRRVDWEIGPYNEELSIDPGHIRRDRLDAGEDEGIFLGVDVVGDDGHGIAITHGLEQHFAKGGLAGADRATDADAKWAVLRAHASLMKTSAKKPAPTSRQRGE